MLPRSTGAYCQSSQANDLSFRPSRHLLFLDIDWVNFQEMSTLKANRVNLQHTCYLGLLGGGGGGVCAKLESAVCPARK